MPKDSVRHRFVAKLRAETCPYTEIRTYLRTGAKSFGTNLGTITNNMCTNFYTQFLVQSIDIIEKVENRLY